MPNFNYDDFRVGHFIKQILEFLNSGGSRKAVINAYRQEYAWADDRFIQERDVTSDGIPELLFAESATLVAFICEGGQYQDVWLLGQTYHFYTPAIITIQDMNLDGVVEIMSGDGDARFRTFNVFEWDGSKFKILNEPSTWVYMPPCSSLYGPS